jgi:hypothetical protein
MSMKLPLGIFVLLLQIFCFFVFLEGELRKRPQGRKLLNFIENRTIKFTNWRADADIKDEIERVKRVFGWSLGSLILLAFIAAVFKLQWLAIFIAPFFIVSFFGYMSLEWIIKWRTVLKLYSGGVLLLIASISFAHYSGLSQYSQLASLSVHFARIVGMTHPAPSLTLTLLVSASVLLFPLLLMTIIAVVVSLGIFAPLWVTSRLSIFFKRTFNKDVLWWTAVCTQILVFILGWIVSIL